MTHLPSPTTATVPTPAKRASLVQRMQLWWSVTTTITELTRDREREDRILAEAAVRMNPGGWGLALLFRRR